MTTTPPIPRGLKAAGRRLWTATMDEYDLDQTAAEQLAQACHTVDLLAEIRAEIAANGLKVTTSQGVSVSPFVKEMRAHQLVLTRLIAGLGLPKDLGEDKDGEEGD